MAADGASAPGSSAGAGSRLLRRGRDLATRRWPLAPAMALCLASAVAGIALPVARPSPSVADEADPLGGMPSAEAGGEDLSAFLASRRWGISLAEAQPAASTAAATGINPLLAALGFVGVSVHGGAFAALVVADGAVVRLTAGAALPDGQTLAAVDRNTVAIRAPDGTQRVLVLFPSVASHPAPVE